MDAHQKYIGGPRFYLKSAWHGLVSFGRQLLLPLVVSGIGLWLWWPSRGELAHRSELGATILGGAVVAFVVAFVQLRSERRLRDRERLFQRFQEDQSFRITVGLQHNLSGIDLHGRDLSGFFLRGKILNKAFLLNARLVGANLADASLEGADLRGANMSQANLQRVAASDADLGGANLSYADCTEANLQRAKVNLTSLQREIAHVRFWKSSSSLWRDQDVPADLTWAKFPSANLNGATLRGARLVGTDLKGAILQRADLRDTDCGEVDLRRAQLQNADLRGAKLEMAKLEGAVASSGTRWPDGFDFSAAGVRV
jgi:uncharacterized protein YjbI with pentapeptide repeats